MDDTFSPSGNLRHLNQFVARSIASLPALSPADAHSERAMLTDLRTTLIDAASLLDSRSELHGDYHDLVDHIGKALE